jgi:hypothetical protein
LLPFSVEQFFEVFSAYNRAIWPVPIVAYVIGVAALGFLYRNGRFADGVTTVVLGTMWLWTGAAYHWLHFASINPAAWWFGIAFVLQGFVLFFAAVTQRLAFGRTDGVRGIVGLALIGYSTVIYPVIGMWSGHRYPAMPMFGVTPCSMTIFTFGCLLLTTKPVPWWVLAIPVVWSIIGGSAAFLLNVPQDWILLFSGVLTVLSLAIRQRSAPV